MDEENDQLWKDFLNSVRELDNVFEEEVDDETDPDYNFLKDLESLEFQEDFEFKSIFDNNDYIDQLSKDLVDQTVGPSEQFSIEHLVELHNQIRCHTQQLTQTWMLALPDNSDLMNKSKSLLETINNEIFFKCGIQNIDPQSNEIRVFHNDIATSALKVIEKEEDFLRSEQNISRRSQKSNLILPHYREVILRHPDVFCFEWALLCNRSTPDQFSVKRLISLAEDGLITHCFQSPTCRVLPSKITDSVLTKLRERYFPDLSSKTLSLHFKRYRALARQIQKTDNLESDQRLKKFSLNPLVRHFMGEPPLKTVSIFTSPSEFGLKPPKWYLNSLAPPQSQPSTVQPISTVSTKKTTETKYILPKGAEIYQIGVEKLIFLPQEVTYTPQIRTDISSPKMAKKAPKFESPVMNEPIQTEMNENDDFEDFEMDVMDETQQSISSNGTSSDTEETDDPRDLLALMQASWTPVHRRSDRGSGVNLKNKSEIRKHTKLFFTHLSKNYKGLSWAEKRNMEAYIKFHLHRMKTILTASEFEEFVTILNTNIDEKTDLLIFYDKVQEYFCKCLKIHSGSIKKTRELKIYSKLFIIFFNHNQAQTLNKSFQHIHWSRVLDFMSKVLLYIHYCYTKPEQRLLYTKRFASIMFKLSTSNESFQQKLSKLKSVLKKMFKGNALLLQEFRGLLLSETPSEYLMQKDCDFEHVDIDNHSQFDSVDLSLSNNDSNFGTKDCSCKCHSHSSLSTTTSSTNDHSEMQHCFSCSLRVISNRIFLPSYSTSSKRNQFVEYQVEKKSVEEKTWAFEENRTLMLKCREYMLVNDIKEYSEDLYGVVAEYIKQTCQIERSVSDIVAKLSQLLDSFEKFINKT